MWDDEEKLQIDKMLMENEASIIDRQSKITQMLAASTPPDDLVATALLLTAVILLRQRDIHVKDACHILRRMWELDQKLPTQAVLPPVVTDLRDEHRIDGVVIADREKLEQTAEEDAKKTLDELRQDLQSKNKENLQ